MLSISQTSAVLVNMYFFFLFFFSIRIYFIRILRLRFAKCYEYFKSTTEAEILKRTQFRLLKVSKFSTVYVFHLSVENYSFH